MGSFEGVRSIARIRFGLPRLGIVWWAGVAISAVGFLALLAVAMFFPA